MNRTNLSVPFAEKDEAKRLGARWDPARKLWYVQGKEDLTPFAKWSPAPSQAAGGGAAQAPGKPKAAAGKVMIGSGYVELPIVCDCPPWETCARCEPVLAKHAGA